MTETTIAAGLPKDKMPKFDLPKMEMPTAVREIADQGVAQAKQNYEKIQAATEEMTAVLKETYPSAARGVADYNLKLMEIAHANSKATFEFACGLFATRSLSEMVELSTKQTRNQFDRVTAQNKELWALAERMASDCAEPIKQGMTKVFDKVVRS
jgi:phasin